MGGALLGLFADLVLFVQLYRRSTLSSGSQCLCQRRLRACRIRRLNLMQKLPCRWFSSCMETSSRIGLWTELIRSSSGGMSITFEMAVILSGSCQFTTDGIDYSTVKWPRALQVRSCHKIRYLCSRLLRVFEIQALCPCFVEGRQCFMKLDSILSHQAH